MAYKRLQLVLLNTLWLIGIQETFASQRPHIVFIMADDLGWNDVGFHGSNQIPTPNIDALAYSGIILNNYYVASLCTPSRSALMTGKHPIHTGMQHTALFVGEPRGLPLTEKLLPQYVKELGYTTRIVGKWHLGSYKKEYTPLYRGFDSHLGYWNDHIDCYDHTNQLQNSWGFDMRRDMDPAWDLHGQYCTDLFTEESVRLIQEHDQRQPLFLYIAHAAVHSGNSYNPLPAPDDVVAKFGNISDYNRRKFAAMLTKLDDSVGQVVAALHNTGMLENTIVIFSTDNGGAGGLDLNAASNWPLRGVKNTLWEGGVRGAGLIFSPFISKPFRVASQLMHVSDWLPTLYAAAGGNVSNLEKIDGVNLWNALSEDSVSERIEVLHNIDDIDGTFALTVGEWKIVKGTTFNGDWDSWYGPSGRVGSYNIVSVESSPAAAALASMGRLASSAQMLQLRKEAEVKCLETKATKSATECQPLKEPCLFNIAEDPCEQQNLANVHPQISTLLQLELMKWNRTAVPAANLPIDSRGDPKLWDHTWTNFGDYITLGNTGTYERREIKCLLFLIILLKFI